MDTDYQADTDWLLNIQRKLFVWSRTEPDGAYRDMWNWVTDPHNLRVAWKRVASNRGARSSGPDRLTVRTIQDRIGVDHFLADTRRRLRTGAYQPTPVRRVMIPKRGKPGQFRPLGVPTVRDRLVQAAVLQLLEPIFEAVFMPVSYGFRPRKAVRDAVEHIRNAIRPTGKKTGKDWPRPPYQWVIEGDIKGCFDNIDHHHVMTRLRSRVGDIKVCRLVLAFLKAGVLADGALLRTPAGTPQGGVLSPLLANITLSAIEERYERFVAQRKTRDGKPYARPGDAIRKFRHYERKAGRPVFLPIRYADDFVVLVEGSQEQAFAEKEDLATFLRDEMKLTLSPEKTRVTSLTEGFVFLGHRIRLRWDKRWGYWPRVEIPRDRIKDIRHRIKQWTTLGRQRLSLQEVIDDLNPLILGWGRFYQHCYGAKRVFSSIDHYVWDRVRRWLRKKFPKTPRMEIRRRYWRRLPGRPRNAWIDQRPIAFVGDIKVGRHNLRLLRYPAYAEPVLESPVHTERCPPGSGAGEEETTGGNPGIGASSPRS
ncbi:group II intron reverse transcriptase/maturase, partial [Magnetospirillum sp. SS-4]|uniref:group II intron reverse transcriptase/maturase n=1 Tax=Magnetospirillum sp. SS-4 TaxID=2681465 RepID=UPI001C2D6340